MENDSVVIGHGMVGKATMKALGINRFYSRSERNVILEDIPRHKYIYICLPTPTNDLGKQDTNAIEYYLTILRDHINRRQDSIVIIRSTVLPGTIRRFTKLFKLKIVHVPEFLTEATWEQDAEYPDIIVIGSDDTEARGEVEGIFRARFKTLSPDYFVTDSRTSETIKYAINCFYATKVVYANQLFDFCQDHGVNYETVKNAMYSRKWIGKNHLEIWHKGGRGAGGKCLKKDLDAFANMSSLPVFEYLNKINKAIIISNPKHS